jgi:hypothetical protein
VVIEFPCSKCGKVLRGGESSVGHRVLCAKCGAFSEVPPPPEHEDDETAGLVFSEETPPEESFPPPADAGTVPLDEDDIYEFAELEEPAEEDVFVADPVDSPFRAQQASRQADDNPYQSPTEYGGLVERWSESDNADRMAILSLVMGLVGFPLMCCCGVFGVVSGIAGIALGVQGLQGNNREIAIAGIVLSSLQVLWTAGTILVWLGAAVFG